MVKQIVPGRGGPKRPAESGLTPVWFLRHTPCSEFPTAPLRSWRLAIMQLTVGLQAVVHRRLTTRFVRAHDGGAETAAGVSVGRLRRHAVAIVLPSEGCRALAGGCSRVRRPPEAVVPSWGPIEAGKGIKPGRADGVGRHGIGRPTCSRPGGSVARVTFTPEAFAEAKALLAANSLDGIAPERKVLRIAVGSCGLKRPVAAPAVPEQGDACLEVDGLPVAIASTLHGDFHVGVGRGRFGAWLTLEQTASG